MDAKEYIRKLNFMVNVGTDFKYKEVYETLTPEDKLIVDEYTENTVFTLSN